MGAHDDDPRPEGSLAVPKIIKLRYAAKCKCGASLAAGSRASWDRASHAVTCLTCLQNQTQAVPSGVVASGVAGVSLQRTYEQRSANDAARKRAAHPRIGGLILALTPERQTTKAFKIGAAGERLAAKWILDRAGPDVPYLLNRSLGAGRRDGDVDMVVIGPSGVFIVDVKNYAADKAISVRHSGGLLRPAQEQLMVGGRDRTSLLVSMRRQMAAVQTTLDSYPGEPEIPVAAVFCFINGLPLFGTLSIDGIPMRRMRGTARLVSAPGDLTKEKRRDVHAYLASLLPPAS